VKEEEKEEVWRVRSDQRDSFEELSPDLQNSKENLHMGC
jgi:hypothetical protein